ncbi:heme exporter protein CcmD [Rubellimicrobium aerolatum]|uniref:Heme exporter protein D n=1 Tax=Rubellimicrobium aerolatum TaxID=490979 RepID=A0ABW0SBF8_9RHOB|nr:heme exporter protein CcmD [Rubellimicrobium aerolatum]MBP1805544.1 heme exporter protein D [Rubellimicrobium aerolatum]
MPDLGTYAVEVLASYAVTLALLGGLAGLSWRRWRRLRAEMERVERGRDG